MVQNHRFSSVRFNQSGIVRSLFIGAFFALGVSLLSVSLSSAAYAQQSTPAPNPDCGGPAYVPPPTNAGTDFLLCFEENIDNSLDASPNFYLEVDVASLGDTATVTISSKAYPGMSRTVFLQPNQSWYEAIDTIMVNGNAQELDSLWMMSSDFVTNNVVEVQSTSPIVCYGMDYRSETADAFCALAQESAGTDYEVICYQNSDTDDVEPTSSEFAVASFEDNDTVTITPTFATRTGHPANVPFKVVLQQGQGIQIQTDPTNPLGDLTGSIITSTHPTTVYSGHERTEIPSGWALNSATPISRDMLLEVMPPTSTWGHSFALNAFVLDDAGTIGPDGDLMRVLALRPNTPVSVNGEPWITLGSVQHPSLFADSLIKGPTLVQSADTSGPLLVGEIEHSDYHIGEGGDPSLAIVPPVDQSFNNYTFFSSGDFGFNAVTIVTDTKSLGTITVDDTLLPNIFFTPVPGTVGGESYAVCEKRVYTMGAHTINSTASPQNGFTILSYGLDDVISYGYTAGSLLVPKRAIRIDNPPQVMGGINGHRTNELTFHNTAYQPAYMDSTVFVPDDPSAKAYGIHASEDIAYSVGRLDIGGTAQVQIVADKALPQPISGKILIYSHLPSYFNIEPGTIPFTLYPDYAQAIVTSDAGLDIGASVTPNPFTSSANVSFWIPSTGDITILLYDELGRVVQHIASREFAAGPYSIRIDRGSLSHGMYMCEISSNELNIHTRVPLIVGE